MKNKSFISTFLIIFFSSGIYAQEHLRIPSDILISFKTGNAVMLARYINPTVQLMVLGKEDFYKKNVAETIMKDFFITYRPKEFIIKHQGGTADAQYAIGNLTTDKNSFRVYFLMKKVGSDFLIHQIRIDPDDSR